MPKHYEHLKDSIEVYFLARGIPVEVENHLTQDFQSIAKGTNGKPLLVGEIKKEEELYRDLPSQYWSYWNNPDTGAKHSRGGGKVKGTRLLEEESLDPSVLALSHKARGFVATVMGQLKSYARHAQRDEGWLVIEHFEHWRQYLDEAFSFLERFNRVKHDLVAIDPEGIGYICITFFV